MLFLGIGRELHFEDAKVALNRGSLVVFDFLLFAMI
jgi:hypothetical protein